MRYGEFIFYNTDELGIDKKAAMLRDCKEISFEWWADILDCSISAARQKYDCSFDEILERLKDKAHVVVIDRRAWGNPMGDSKEHFEIGFQSMESPVDYFLFIEVDSNKMRPILDKYQLKPMV